MASLNPNCLYKDPLSKFNHVLMSQGLNIQHMNLGKEAIQSIIHGHTFLNNPELRLPMKLSALLFLFIPWSLSPF